MADPKPPIDSKFLADNGLCVQGGMLALEASAAKPTKETFLVAQLDPKAQEVLEDAAKLKLQACAKPSQVAHNIPYAGPKR